jgi:long-chain acyl-CoA synthetase
MATVVLNASPAHGVSDDDLRDWVNERVEARYQKVSRIVIMDDFPRSVAGKTLKRVMRQPFWEEHGTEI